MERGAIQTLDREVLELISHLVTDGGITFIGDSRCRRRFRCIRGSRHSSGRCLRLRRCRLLRHLCIFPACSRFLSGDSLFNGRVQEIKPDQCHAKDRQRNDPENTGEAASLLSGILGLPCTPAVRGDEGISAGLEGNCLLIADAHTLGAVNALMVTHMPDIHAAVPYAGTAVIAAVLVYFHAHDAEFIEQSVNRTQRADEAAETAIAEDTGKSNDQHDDKFPGKEDAKH